jgi:hypothetical protein
MALYDHLGSCEKLEKLNIANRAHTLNVGGIPISIDGNSVLRDILLDELSSFASECSPEPKDAIRVEVSAKRLYPEGESLCTEDLVFIGRTSIFVNLRYPLRDFSVRIRGIPWTTACLGFDISCNGKYSLNTLLKKLKEAPFRVLYSNYLPRIRNVANDFLMLLEGFLHLAMLQKNRAFLHASAIEKDGEALVFTGPGGAGKTTCLTELVRMSRLRFLSDDLTVVDSNGRAIGYPRHMNIYDYNVEQSPEIFSEVFKHRSIFDRLCWNLRKTLGLKNLRHTPVDQVFDTRRIGSDGSISKVIFLSRFTSNHFQTRQLQPNDTAEKCASIFMIEFMDFIRFLSVWRSFDVSLPSIDAVILRTRAIYESAFKNASCFDVLVPKRASPKQLVNFITSSVCEI